MDSILHPFSFMHISHMQKNINNKINMKDDEDDEIYNNKKVII